GAGGAVDRSGAVEELEQSFDPPANAERELVETQRRLMRSEWVDFEAHLRVLNDDVVRRRGERAGVEAAVASLTRSVPVQRQRYEMREQLASTGAGSRLNQLEEQQRLLAEERELAVQRQRLVELAAGITQAESQVRQYESEFRRTHLADLNEAEQK